MTSLNDEVFQHENALGRGPHSADFGKYPAAEDDTVIAILL